MKNIGIASSFILASTCYSQVRVAHWNVAGMKGNSSAMTYVISEMHNDDAKGWAQPVDIITFNEVPSTIINNLKTVVNQAAPTGITYTLATYTVASTENGASGAQAMFYRSDRFTEVTSLHNDIFTDAGRYADRWVLKLNGYNSNDARICVYGAHLKASKGSAEESLRLFGINAICQNALTLGSTIPIVYTGDMNFYTNTETGYAALIAAGTVAGVDPYGTGSWSGATNAYKHTQAPAVTGQNGLVGGGLNDRFDFIMPSTAAATGEGISMIASTMRAVGNDGSHYNTDINAGNNTYFSNLTRSNTLSDKLWIASDHIPQILDFQVPAKLSASFVNLPTKIPVGSSTQLQIKIQNTASYYTATGVDELDYSLTCSGNASGTYSGIAGLTPNYSNVNVNVNTNNIGIASGTITITSNSKAVEPNSIQLNFSIPIYLEGDLDESGTVDSGDIGMLLLEFGACPNCDADLDQNGFVDSGDIALLLLMFT